MPLTTAPDLTNRPARALVRIEDPMGSGQVMYEYWNSAGVMLFSARLHPAVPREWIESRLAEAAAQLEAIGVATASHGAASAAPWLSLVP